MSVFIRSPSCLCLYRNKFIVDTNKFFHEIYTCKKKKNSKITIDLSELKLITAGAAVYLFALISNFQIEINHDIFTIIWPKDKSSKKIMVDSGLFKLLKSGNKDKLQSIFRDDTNFFCGIHEDVGKCKDAIKDRTKNGELSVLLDSALQETFLNINHHAYDNVSNKKIAWWCYVQLGEDNLGNYLSTTICDLGVTIPYTMRNITTIYEIRTESEFIATAMVERMTSTKDKDRGKGSSDIQSPVEYSQCENSYLFIYSGKGKYFMGKKKEDDSDIDFNLIHPYTLHGTVVEWRLYY